MSSFPIEYLSPINYAQIIEAIEHLKLKNSPRNDLERCLKNAIESSSKTESVKETKKVFEKSEKSTFPFKQGKKLCMHFRNGNCRFGDNCTYLHKMCTNTACKEEAQETCKYGHSSSVIKKFSKSDEDEDEDS
jgi:hypothetical protein